ncbi:amino acid adenylation domain-containing protein [Streptomyces sp. AP-93]|uniref:amino acid adenylation domain-containing protein n=1 Tax=Streptomyces sp. AP-93 TaxID=2929048 RepID=UPI0027E51A57|nr:amino acid adenylation domain-containing protein [Streptomyces sp. AP-93]
MTPDDGAQVSSDTAELVMDGGLHEMVARVAASSPHSVALRAHGRDVTYAALDEASTRWAAELASRGIGPGTLVPVLLPRSVRLVTALLAVLKSGAAFALLDPQWPQPRLLSVIRDLEATVVVDDDPANCLGLSVWTPPDEDLTDFSRESAGGTSRSTDFRPVAVGSDEASCVFFTSGTTGRAKGVVVPHRSISRLFVDETFACFDRRTVMTLAAATPWDAFALELWGSLLRGGTSVIIEEPFLTPDLLRRVISEDGVNTVWLTSSVFNIVVDEDLSALAGLSQVMVGGERLSVDHVRRFLEAHPAIELTNGYGPVESTIFASAHRVMPMDYLRPGGIPLGLCVPATRIYVLDGDRECGDDEEGEICVTGDGLAIGYLGDPELTAERFATYVLDGRPTRVYRTGDLGVWRSPDGLLEFLGRADRQVKVRGHRVEPADVEQAVLNMSPAVVDCRVVARRTALDDAYELVAFCVPRERGDRLTGLLGLIEEHLPSYQCPSRLLVIDELPLNDRGKVSEARLLEWLADEPEPDPTRTPERADTGAKAVEPSGDELRDIVAGTFTQVLGRTDVPDDLSFFGLGGSSLDAGRLCARLGQSTGQMIPLSQFYRDPSVSGLTARLREAREAARDEEKHEPEPVADLELSQVQSAFLLRDVVQPDGLTNHCLVAWTLTGQVDLEALDRAVVAVHERHEPLRAEYTLEPRPHMADTDIDAPPLHLLRPANSFGAAVEALKEELALPFDPEEGIVWRTAIVPVLSGDVSVFGCSFHHVAFDGWSEAVLADDLSRAYNGEVEAPPPPGLTQLAQLRRTKSDRTQIEGQLRAQADTLRGVPEITWPEVPPTTTGSGIEAISERLTPEEYATVSRAARERATTPFTVLLTAWGWTLAETLTVTDTAVGVPVADRASVGDERAMCCQLTVVPIRLNGPSLCDGHDVSFAEAVDFTARRIESALACLEAPSDRLAELVGPASRGRTPIFQMMFALQDNRTADLRLNGLTVSRLRLPYLDVPMELHCEIWPTEDGGLLVEVTYHVTAVSASVARTLLSGFLDHIRKTEG